MSLVERLGFKTLKHLYNELDNNDIMEWAAYDMLQNPEWLEEQKKQKALEQQKGQTLEDEAKAVRRLLVGLG